MANPTRITLLDRIRQTTDGKSWEEFVQVYDRLVLGWLQRHDVQPADADDIRQEVMTTVYQEIGQFEHNGRPGAFRNWLRLITSNRLHRFWQKRQTRKSQSPSTHLSQLAEELADDNSRLSSAWNVEHDRCIVEHLLGELATRFGERSILAFRRIALQEEPAQAVAEDLGMTLGAARVAQHRVLKALKELGEGLIETQGRAAS